MKIITIYLQYHHSSPVHLSGSGRLQLFLLESLGQVGQQYSQEEEQEEYTCGRKVTSQNGIMKLFLENMISFHKV